VCSGRRKVSQGDLTHTDGAAVPRAPVTRERTRAEQGLVHRHSSVLPGWGFSDVHRFQRHQVMTLAKSANSGVNCGCAGAPSGDAEPMRPRRHRAHSSTAADATDQATIEPMTHPRQAERSRRFMPLPTGRDSDCRRCGRNDWARRPIRAMERVCVPHASAQPAAAYRSGYRTILMRAAKCSRNIRLGDDIFLTGNVSIDHSRSYSRVIFFSRAAREA
jgi:hypothetical protein